MDDGDIERFEEERELELYREYRDVLPMFAYVIEERLGDARADPVVAPALEDDDVLKVEVHAAVADDAADPDERAVDIAGEHRGERGPKPFRRLHGIDGRPAGVRTERGVFLGS